MNENTSELAYDGSSHPPRRELTTRERDILCRLISDVMAHAFHDKPRFTGELPTPGWTWSPVPVRIGEPDFFQRLAEIGAAIDPRES